MEPITVKRVLAVTVLTGVSSTRSMFAIHTEDAPITRVLSDGELEFGVRFVDKGSKALLNLSIPTTLYRSV